MKTLTKIISVATRIAAAILILNLLFTDNHMEMWLVMIVVALLDIRENTKREKY